MGMKKGQISSELLIIVGMVLLLFLPLLITIYLKSGETNERLTSFQSTIAQSRLVHTINAIGHLGSEAHIITEIYIPPDVQRIEFISAPEGGEVVFRVRSGERFSELADVVKFPVDYVGSPIENPNPGIYRFRISNTKNVVSVERIS